MPCANTMPSERFIPFRKADIIEMCKPMLSDKIDISAFDSLCKLLVNRIHYQYHEQLESLKSSYAFFDPNKDTRSIESVNTETLKQVQKKFAGDFSHLLNAANFEKVTDHDLEEALTEESLFKVRLAVSFDDFQEVVFYRRGESVKTEVIRYLFGLRKKAISFTNYDRVAVYITFKDDAYFAQKGELPVGFSPGSTIIKLFQNVPKADLEMLFPNSEVRMRPLDKVIIGASAAIGGAVVLVTKLGASMLLLASVLAFWLGFKDEQVEITKQSLISFGLGMGVLGSFVFKEWTKFKNRKIRFMKALSDNLYFKSLDNNAGVFHTLIDAAEEEDCKEAILAYTFLLNGAAGGMTAEALDSDIEQWFNNQYHCELDFDVKDALDKLLAMKLIIQTNLTYQARPIEDCARELDYYWDNLFQI